MFVHEGALFFHLSNGAYYAPCCLLQFQQNASENLNRKKLVFTRWMTRSKRTEKSRHSLNMTIDVIMESALSATNTRASIRLPGIQWPPLIVGIYTETNARARLEIKEKKVDCNQPATVGWLTKRTAEHRAAPEWKTYKHSTEHMANAMVFRSLYFCSFLFRIRCIQM